MYIENLEMQDFENFAKLFNCSVSKVDKNKTEVYIQLFTGAMGPQPEMWISDFELKTSVYYKDFEKKLQTEYILLMKEKFGKKYQEDYTKHYNKKIEEERII